MRISFRFIIVLCLLTLLASPVWSKALIYKIVIRGNDLSESLTIADDDIVEQFSIWSGPNSRWRSNGGEWQTDYNGAFIDFQAGLAHERQAGLLLFDVEFWLMENRTGGYWDEPYKVRYAIKPSGKGGYFYLPTGQSSLNGNFIYHGVEGNWLHSADSWETAVRPLIQNRLNSLK